MNIAHIAQRKVIHILSIHMKKTLFKQTQKHSHRQPFSAFNIMSLSFSFRFCWSKNHCDLWRHLLCSYVLCVYVYLYTNQPTNRNNILYENMNMGFRVYSLEFCYIRNMLGSHSPFWIRIFQTLTTTAHKEDKIMINCMVTISEHEWTGKIMKWYLVL